MIEVDKVNRGFSPSVEWMSKRYDELNHKLFGGRLDKCNFELFTTGKGSQGNTLGWFSIKGRNIKYNRSSRKMYRDTFVDKILVNKSNFVELCVPTISLNANYTGTEYGFLATLAHEMCHYYNYMEGFVPGKAHGREFMMIGNIISLKSDGLFSIQRLASAEDMSHLDLNDEMKARNEKRLAKKKSNIYAFFDYRSNDDIRLVTTNNEKLMNAICDFTRYNPRSRQVIITNDSTVIDLLFEKGYNKNFRTWRHWQVAGKDWLSILDNADKEIKKNPKFMNENKVKRNIDEIICETINNFIREKIEDNGDDISITPDMNLGLYSPIEIYQ